MSNFSPYFLFHRWLSKNFKQTKRYNDGGFTDAVGYHHNSTFIRWNHLMIIMNLVFFISMILFNVGLFFKFGKELSWVIEEIVYFGMLCFTNVFFIRYFWRKK